MLEKIWYDTFDKLEKFTHELEKEKSYVAVYELKPLWRVMKSIQLRFIPNLEEKVAQRQNAAIERLDIRDVAPSAFTEAAALSFIKNLGLSCSIDPTKFDI